MKTKRKIRKKEKKVKQLEKADNEDGQMIEKTSNDSPT